MEENDPKDQDERSIGQKMRDMFFEKKQVSEVKDPKTGKMREMSTEELTKKLKERRRP